MRGPRGNLKQAVKIACFPLIKLFVQSGRVPDPELLPLACKAGNVAVVNIPHTQKCHLPLQGFQQLVNQVI